MENRLLIILIFTLYSYSLWASVDKLEIDKRNNLDATEFINSISVDDKKLILDKIKRINNYKSSDGIVQVFKEKHSNEFSLSPIILFVQGARKSNTYDEMLAWYRPFNYLSRKDMMVFMQTLDVWKGINSNAKILEDNIFSFMKQFPQREIIVLGYSAGGVVTIQALDNMLSKLSNRINDRERLRVVTMATPLAGYNAPMIAKIAYPFVGVFSIDIGIGTLKLSSSNPLSNCEHHLTTNCNIDIHACPNDGKYPQILLDKIQEVDAFEEAINLMDMPCGNKNVILHENDNHYSIILSTLKSVLK